MLTEAHGISRIVIACGYTDLRIGIEGLSRIVGNNYSLNPFEKNILFLFCGRQNDKIKPGFPNYHTMNLSKLVAEYDMDYLSEVKAFAMDINASYNKLVEEYMPEVESVYDRYHMVTKTMTTFSFLFAIFQFLRIIC